jgi:ankyrin repeat protein
VGRTPLHRAVVFQPEAVLELYSTNIHIQDYQGFTALHYAAIYQPQSVLHLIMRGANIHAREAHGATPLHLACEYLQGEAVRVLLDHGADMTSLDFSGRTPYAYVSMDTWMSWITL